MDINRREVLRYLGYNGQAIKSELNLLINSCIDEIKSIAKPLFTYKVLNIKASEDSVKLLNCSLSLKGKDIKNHLINSDTCVVLAATLGTAVDNRIRFLNKVHMTRALILDACATEAMESLCNVVENEIKFLAEEHSLSLTHRYSPGYGDFPLCMQSEILNLLNTPANIGLTCTEDFILIPRKSVTAVIGLYKNNSPVQNEENFKECKHCSICSSSGACLYSKEG